ncbi:DUF6074 family protein [Mesorhizobium sp.]|uniref:DUF6074 family protein n=1 Tax=Mesorhizobium sp. TaxID=1871066 RepID=UPI00257BDB6D|nr:DUF6074 family protein [Mesorhizobium sp.]
MRGLSPHAIDDAVCTVLPFPTVRRVGKIRRTVEVLSDRTGKGGNQYWKQVIAACGRKWCPLAWPTRSLTRNFGRLPTRFSAESGITVNPKPMVQHEIDWPSDAANCIREILAA